MPTPPKKVSLLRDYPRTDLGNAERLVSKFSENFRFIPAWNDWIVWKGDHWERDRSYLYQRAEGITRGLYHEASELPETTPQEQAAKAAAKKFARECENVNRVKAMIELAQHRPGVSLDHTKLNAQPMLFPCSNGTIDLNTGKLRASMRQDYLTLASRIRYDMTAKCPTWEAFLRRTMDGDEEMIAFLQRAVGYSLTGDVGEHALFFCYGPKGKNGKSTFMTTIRNLAGAFGSMAPRKLLFQSSADRHPVELTTLFGKRLVTCSEVPESQVFDEALIKDLTGGEAITARHIAENFWSYEPTHHLWLQGNYKMQIVGTDGGIWRRVLLIPWDITIPEEERDLQLSEKLQRELPGILAWAVRGCLAWKKERLGIPAKVHNASLQYRRESDLPGEFFRLFLTFEAEGRISKRQLRQKYEQWCEDVGAKPIGAHKMNARLRNGGCLDTTVREKVPGKVGLGPPVDGWTGVRFKTAAEIEAVRKWDPHEDWEH